MLCRLSIMDPMVARFSAFDVMFFRETSCREGSMMFLRFCKR